MWNKFANNLQHLGSIVEIIKGFKQNALAQKQLQMSKETFESNLALHKLAILEKPPDIMDMSSEDYEVLKNNISKLAIL